MTVMPGEKTWPGLLYICLAVVAALGFAFSVLVKQDNALNVFAAAVAAGGFMLSVYIWYIKRSRRTLVCPTGSDCNAVIFSQYSRFLGVPLEQAGTFYYLAVLLFYVFSAGWPGAASPGVVAGALVLTSAAWLFSLYLTAIQAFVLKQWCTWCLLSMVFSSIIFFISVNSLAVGAAFLAAAQPSLLVARWLALALGVGGATVAAVLFYKFLKDLRISEFEKGVLHTVFQITWLALIVLVLTEVLLYVVEVGGWASISFLLKALAVVVIVGGEMVINFIMVPRLFVMPAREAARWRRAALGLGAAVVSAWYFAFVLDVVLTGI